MIHAAVTLLTTLVLVFSVTFVVVHHLTSEPAQVPQPVALPAAPPAAAGGSLRVRTLGRAAALPALRRAPAGSAGALIDAPPSPAPPGSSSLRAKAAGG